MPIIQSLQTGKAIIGREYQLVRRDGKKVDIQVNTAPIHNKTNKIIAAALIMNDVTAQKEIEQRKDDFVNMASHELKTPITSIKLFLDVLTREVEQYNNTRANHILTNIKDQTTRLQNLVNDLLDVSRLQTGKMSIKKEQFRLDIFVEDTLKQMDEATTQKIILAKKRRLKVLADKLRIYQVLTNLLSNAVKYSAGKGDIIVNLDKKNDKALISIQDFGIGIPQDEQKKIFDRLYQVADDKSNTFPGFGMGLYIVKEIIKRHKGTIWVESADGKGSTFYFTLPLVK
jgi:signal transduction histidine kinase